MSAAPGRRIAGNARAILLGNAAYAVGGWVQLAILARAGGAEAVGAWAYALALTAPVMMLAALQLRMLQASDTRGVYAFREYLRVRVGTTVVAAAALAALGAWTGAAGAPGLLAAVVAMRAADALSDVFQGVWQRQERMGVAGLALALNAAASVAAMAGAVALGLGPTGAAAGAALGSIAALGWVLRRTLRDGEVGAVVRAPAPFSAARTARLVREAAPLGVIVLLGSLQQNVPRYFVQAAGGEAALGVYAAAAQLTAAGTMVVGALGGAATPRLATLWAGGERGGFGALAGRLALAGLGLGVAGVALSAWAGPAVLAWLYRPEFAAGAGVLLVLSVAAGLSFVATLLGYALTAARVIAAQPVVLLASLAVLGAGCAALVPRWGGEGAAAALAAAAGVQAAASLAVLRRAMRDGVTVRPGTAPAS